MAARIVALTVFPRKDEPGVSLPGMRLVEDLGIEGNRLQGGERQVALCSVETRRWMSEQPEAGLCFARFRENILLEGLPLESIQPGDTISAGSAVLRISGFTKPCFDGCALHAKGTPCRLSGRALFAVVEESGWIEEGDSVTRHSGSIAQNGVEKPDNT